MTTVWLTLATMTTLAMPAVAVIPPPNGAYRHISAAGREIETVKIADGIYQFTVVRDGYVRQLNSVVIVCDDGVVVFDTCTRPSSARLILAEIHRITALPVRVVINSHWHPDHWSGNEVFARAFPGLEIIATEFTRSAMENTGPLWANRFATDLKAQQATLDQAIARGALADGTPLTPELRREMEEDLRDYRSLAQEAASAHRALPTLTYVDHLELHRGGRDLRLMSMTGDAAATTVLYLPHENILITGDVVSYPIPYASRPSEHAVSLRTLAALHARTVIPGHGPAFHDNDYIELEAQLMEKIVQGVHEALRRGAEKLEQVQEAVTVDELRTKFSGGDPELDRRYRDRVKAIVERAVREARGGADL
jgi:cyclase